MSTGERPAFERREASWLGPLDAQRRILAACSPLPPEEVPLQEALGRALAQDLAARATLPPWDNAAMDGYAVRARDVEKASLSAPVILRVAGRASAGSPAPPPLDPGTAVRIMTGAPLPGGADSVVRVEDTDAEVEPGSVRVLSARDAGRNVRPRGQDFRPGDVLLREGDPLHPGALGVAAALGHERLRVRRRPTVAILTTGDELRGPGSYDAVCAGEGIPDSNGPMLAASVAGAGGIPRVVGPIPDEGPRLREALGECADADVLVTVGGASMGEADLVKRVLDDAGYRPDFWRVSMRPGSPFGFGRLPREGGREQPVFGLPGNPASAFVTFEVFVRPFLLRLGGHARVHRRRVTCRAGEEIGGGRRTLFLRVRLRRDAGPGIHAPPTAVLAGPQGSGLVRSLSDADGLAIVPPGVRYLPGEDLEVLLLDPGPAGAPDTPLEGIPS